MYPQNLALIVQFVFEFRCPHPYRYTPTRKQTGMMPKTAFIALGSLKHSCKVLIVIVTL